MQPILFTIGKYNAYSFGFFLAVAFILATFVIWRYGKEELREEEYLDAFFYTSIVSLFCARLTYILSHTQEFGQNILKYIVLHQTPGLSLLGGMVGGFAFLWWYTKRKKLQTLHTLDLFSVATSVALVFAKIGEQLGGAGFGKETNGPLGVRITGVSGRHHPVELYEAVAFLLLTIFLVFVYHKQRYHKWPKGLVFCFFIFFLSMIVFGLEFLKTYEVYYYGLSGRHFASFILLLVILTPLSMRIKSLIIGERGKK